ncbi:hypothetical protein ACSBR1_019059 [Camellia fascicularis]
MVTNVSFFGKLTLLSQVGRQPPTREAGQTVGGRVELVIYVITLSCNIYIKFKILCKPHDCASSAPLVPVRRKSAPPPTLTGLNIREAHVFSTTDGYSLDVFVVDGWPVEGSVVSPNVADFAMLWSRYKGIIRFGKFVEIQFDKHGKISGAAVRTYLLERSRVCQVSDPERNCHCFYMLCAAPPEDVKKFKLGDPKTYHYLNQTNCYEVANVDDAREYLETRNAMDIVGISQDEQDAIFRVHLQTAAELLMCDEKALEDSLYKRVIVTPDGNVTKPLDPASAVTSRDALEKTIYSRLFDWYTKSRTHSMNKQRWHLTSEGDMGNNNIDSDSVVARTFLIRTKTEEDRNKLAAAIQQYVPPA